MARKNVDTMLLDSGCLCFDLANTVDSRNVASPYEYIRSYADLLKWSKRIKALPESRLKRLEERSAREQHSTAGAAVPAQDEALAYFRKARETVYRFFSAMAAGRSPERETTDGFNGLMHETLQQLVFIPDNGRIHLDWIPDRLHLNEPVWAALKSAYDVLCTEDHKRIKECEACGWLFLDRTKNNRKRWCSPDTCGSADKARRYYHRKKQQSS